MVCATGTPASLHGIVGNSALSSRTLTLCPRHKRTRHLREAGSPLREPLGLTFSLASAPLLEGCMNSSGDFLGDIIYGFNMIFEHNY